MKKILAIDDDRKFLKVLQKRLVDRGYEVNTTDTTLEAKKILKKGKPDVILLDVKMPKGGGIEFLEEFYAKDKNREVKTILLTNFDPNEVETQRILTKAPFSVLLKIDTSIEDLIQEIEKPIN